MEGSDTPSLEIYKYRRKSLREELFFRKPLVDIEDGDKTLDHGISFKIDEEKPKQKAYAVLQESRAEFANSRLRYAFVVYSSPGWKAFILSIILISYILDSLVYTFCEAEERPFIVIVLIICMNLVFTIDVAFLFVIKFSKTWRKILNIVEPGTYRTAFEGVLAVPYSVLYLWRTQSAPFDYHAIVPIVALVRDFRIVEFFYTRASQAGSNQWTTFLFQYLILFLLSVHTWTCIWYLFANQEFDVDKMRSSWSSTATHLPTESTFDWYFVCAYMSIMFLTTNALGDIYPVTTTERIFAILAILLGFILTTIVFVGSLTSQFITITTRRSKYVRQLKKIQNHLKLINMDSDTAKRIIRYYEDLWYQKSGVFKPELMKLLPYPLQMEICYDLNAVPLYSSLIFRQLPEPFLRRLSLAMTHHFYLPGDIVYNHNQNKTIMICITRGVLELLSDEDDESPMISFCKGTCLGEISLVYNIPARCTVKAATYVECQVLDKKEFIKLMLIYPDIVDIVRKNIQQRIDRCKERKTMQPMDAPLSLNIYASKERKKSSIKCLKDKLKYIQGKSEEDTVTKEDQLDENCLDLYVIYEHVKKRTTHFTCIYANFPWILEHDCYFVKYWELYMLLVTFYICLVYPYFIGFKRHFPEGYFFYAEIVITISLIFNMIMTCFTAIKTKKKYYRKFKAILNYRMNTLGFYLDMVAIIPFEYLVTIHSVGGYLHNFRNHLFYVCKGIKLCLVWRISSFFEELEKKLLLNTILVKIAKYTLYICLLCYWCGVILFMEACFVSRCSDSSWYEKAFTRNLQNIRKGLPSKTEYIYITSVYFATTILLADGYGDLAPGDQFDMGLVAFLSLYGVLLIGYCVAEFSALITHWSKTKTAFLEVIITMDKFMKENNMHHAIKSRIMAFYELQWQYNSGVELTGESWLEKTVVPSELRKKVLHQARFKALTSIRFFQVKNKAYIHTITEMAKDIILPPGEIVYYGGTVTRELYIIESGYCVVKSKDHKDYRKERIIGPGNHLGLLVLLYGVPAVSTVVTLTHCKLICIDHSAYTSALSLFPDMKEHDGLLTPEELNMIETTAKTEGLDGNFRHYSTAEIKNRKTIITSLLQNFLDESFINVYSYYNERRLSYIKSFNEFHAMKNIAPYLLMPYAIKPNGPFLKAWTVFRVAIGFLICILVPAVALQFFCKNGNVVMWIIISMAPSCKAFNEIIVVMEAICYLDIFLRMHVAYYGPKNQLIYHPYLTAKNYFTGAFFLDILTCFPWYAIGKLVLPNHNEGHTTVDHLNNHHVYHCILRMVNVLQIYKLYAAFWAESIGALKRAYLMSVVQFLLLTLFFLNLYSSLLITLSCRYIIATSPEDLLERIKKATLDGPFMKTRFQPDGNMICQAGSWIDEPKIKMMNDVLTPAKVYLLALYWTASSFSGAGFGDFTAQDTTHIILSICVNMHGAFFFGYVYAKIASLKAVADQVITKFQENLKHLDMFLTREKVPFILKQNVIEYWKYQWKRTGGWSHQSILGKLHANLNEDAVLYMYEKTLREIPLFEGVEYSFFRAFAKKLKELYFQKGYVVVRSNEVMSDMYIIYRGKVDIMCDINEVEACMGPGGIFGNIRGANRYLTMSNVVASRNIDLLRINGPAFYALLKSYPSVLRKVKRSIDSAAKDYVIPTVSSEKSSLSQEDNVILSDEEEEEDSVIDLEPNFMTDSPEKSIAESHGSRSITSAGNADYVQATHLCFKPHRWFRSSVIPDSKFVSFMDYFVIILAYVDFMILVYQMAFLSNEYFLYICIASDTIFIYKVFLDIHTGYMNRYGDYILDPRKVRKMYFSKIFHRRRDFLSNFLICYLAFALPLETTNMQNALFCYMRTPQLFRVSYLSTYRTHRKLNIGSANLFFKLTSIGVWATVLSHVYACLFFKLSCMTAIQCTSPNWMMKKELNLRLNYGESNYFAIYIAALWYIINLLTITGTGDVSSQTDFEVIETVIIIIVIKFCAGLLISEMSSMITAHSSSRIAYDYGINELRDGMMDMNLSEHQMNKMWAYVRELWNRQQGRQMPELVYDLPFRLHCQVMQAVFGSHIRESVIFSKTDDDFRRMLSMWMRHCVFFPGNYIVQCGDSDQCIYFIHRGEVEVLTVHPNLTESIYDILGPEDSFGIAQGLYVGLSHHFSFRARTVVDTVYLKLDQWKYLLDFYPHSARIVQRKVQNVYLAI